MKYSRKLLVTVVLALTLVFAMSAAALAADVAPISIQLDGEKLVTGDVNPVLVEGRTYIPFRVLFEAMGAEVNYDDATRTVSATRDGIKIDFVVGKTDVTVTEGETKQVVKTDAASFIQNGRTLVPVRFAAQALDCNVGWDSLNRTVVIIDNTKLLAAYQDKFTIIDKIFADSAKYSEKSYAFTGTMNVSMKITEDGKIIPASMDGRISGITSADAAEMNIDLAFDFDKLIKASLDEADENDKAEAEAMLDMLKNVKCEYIIDLKTGMYYLRSDLYSQLFGIEKGAWIAFDLNKMMEDMGSANFDSLVNSSKMTDMNDLLSMMISLQPVYTVNDYDALVTMLDKIEAVVGDKAFIKKGDTYTAKTEYTENGVAMSFSCVVTMKKDALYSYTIDLAVEAEDEGNMEMSIKQTAAGKMDMTMDISIMDMLTLQMNMNMKYTETTKTPATAPDEDDTVVVLDLMELLGSAMLGQTVAP